jgi:hypothetical protein
LRERLRGRLGVRERERNRERIREIERLKDIRLIELLIELLI